MTGRLQWGIPELTLTLEWDEFSAPRLAEVSAAGVTSTMPAGLPLVDPVTVGAGHVPASGRLVHAQIGLEVRMVAHETVARAGRTELRVTTRHEPTGLEFVTVLSAVAGVAAVRSATTVINRGARAQRLRSMPSLSLYAGATGSESAADESWELHRATSEWLGEGRWTAEPVPGPRFPRIAEELTGHNPRADEAVVSTGTWSTGRALPMGMLVSRSTGATWAWQLEHQGEWRWEVNRDTAGPYVAMSGPTDADHGWLAVLEPGDEFTTVPASLVLGSDVDAAISALTAYRRAHRRAHVDNARPAIVFNDYMNTLNGDPTTEKLEPLIDAAAEAGAEIFCIDAGWYDDGGDWWDSVGEWKPSTTRFPGGLGLVIDRIKARGMVAGLWLEPEVVGVKSPVADVLPAEAFMQRAGERIVEHDRYHLDLRHPAARAHLDATVDRLVTEFGVGFFKLDYNINPGTGSDHASISAAAALLDHNRAHLAWLDGVLDRHPDLVLESCSSGAMRADWAMLSRTQLQSTSDQQDFLLYPPIAAAAPLAMLPEQAASWAYPQAHMALEEAAFCLVTGLAGRFYLSGYLNEMDEAHAGLVADAVAAAASLRPHLVEAVPFWPIGLPRWDDAWVVLGLRHDTTVVLIAWNRDPAVPEISIPGAADGIEQIFPRSLDAWSAEPGEGGESIVLRNPTGSVSARVLQYDATSPTSGVTHPSSDAGARR
ncbi:glycoside hydrolase family 36 protein [Demequina lignilytica]|uniref:Alpha-galactosidase n=1 Tax=Demequina lignilytica TaxID=3051663 RepID=A0AB35MI97_9MICO|nr:glycoside hydrolase family 36 protein [Demequina sp. SYSU T0a273]MDN4483499.1 alpha-galactosidase [Demequina sp. SYSU T0a273]